MGNHMHFHYPAQHGHETTSTDEEVPASTAEVGLLKNLSSGGETCFAEYQFAALISDKRPMDTCVLICKISKEHETTIRVQTRPSCVPLILMTIIAMQNYLLVKIKPPSKATLDT